MNKTDFRETLFSEIPEEFSQTFPELSIPSAPATVEAAIIASANCQRESLRWLNTFKDMKAGDLALFAGNKNSILELMLQSSLRHKDMPGNVKTLSSIIEILGGTEVGASFTSAAFAPTSVPDEPIIPTLITLFPLEVDLLGRLQDLENQCIEYMKASPILQQVGRILYTALVGWLVRYLFGGSLPIPSIDEGGQPHGQDIASAIREAVDELSIIADTEPMLEIGLDAYYLKSKVVRS